MKLNIKKLEKATPAILKECATVLIKIVQRNIKNNLFAKAPWGSPLAPDTIKRRAKKRKNGVSIPQINTPLYETGKFMNEFTQKTAVWNKVIVYSTGKAKNIIRAFSHYWSSDGKGRNVFRKDQPSGAGGDVEKRLTDIANKRYAKVMRVEAKRFAKQLQRTVK